MNQVRENLIRDLRSQIMWEQVLITTCEAFIESKKPLIEKLRAEIARLESIKD